MKLLKTMMAVFVTEMAFGCVPAAACGTTTAYTDPSCANIGLPNAFNSPQNDPANLNDPAYIEQVQRNGYGILGNAILDALANSNASEARIASPVPAAHPPPDRYPAVRHRHYRHHRRHVEP